jgi:S-adenosylmethionine:tRNA ribosyltransferase-isomerase
MEKDIRMKDYWYELPPDRIAMHPLPERDQSNLLVYRDGQIQHSKFAHLSSYLPAKSTLFFNDTKVIPARLLFQKETGATIELFLLNPVWPSSLVQLAMEARQTNRWICTIGNLKRWPNQTVLTKKINGLSINATLINREEGLVEFNWKPADITFAEIISQAGATPLPPYLKRQAEESDRLRYQTVYSKPEGAVAAPTAGLHFTEKTLKEIKLLGHSVEFLTLHVSAGTFQPMKTDNPKEHIMHREQMVVARKTIEALLSANSTVAVGTTSVRTLESLYWYGVKLLSDAHATFEISQHDCHQLPAGIPKTKALEAVINKMEVENLEVITGETSIMIVPGYEFNVVDAMITNFHQPGSTLILLVAAFIGSDWKAVYKEAIDKGYRFLSYGDSSLLFRKGK